MRNSIQNNRGENVLGFSFLAPSNGLPLASLAIATYQAGQIKCSVAVHCDTKDREETGMDWRANRQMISTGLNCLYLYACLFSDDNRHFQKERLYIHQNKTDKMSSAERWLYPRVCTHESCSLESLALLTVWFSFKFVHVVRA